MVMIKAKKERKKERKKGNSDALKYEKKERMEIVIFLYKRKKERKKERKKP